MASVKRILLGSLVAAGLLLIPVAAAPFALAGNPCYHEFVVPDVTAAAATEIQLQPCAFEPTISVVQAGETVTFRNSTADTHLVTGANAEWGDRDIQVGAHQSIAYTFDEPGVYPYACTIHPGMSGAIVVGDGGEPLAAAFAAATAGGGGGRTPRVAPARALRPRPPRLSPRHRRSIRWWSPPWPAWPELRSRCWSWPSSRAPGVRRGPPRATPRPRRHRLPSR